MFCKNCGREISENAAVCPHCGVQVGRLSNGGETEGNVIAIVGFVFAFLVPIVGLICSIIGYNKAKAGAPYKGLALAGIIISVVDIGLSIMVFAITCAAVAGVAGGMIV